MKKPAEPQNQRFSKIKRIKTSDLAKNTYKNFISELSVGSFKNQQLLPRLRGMYSYKLTTYL